MSMCPCVGTLVSPGKDTNCLNKETTASVQIVSLIIFFKHFFFFFIILNFFGMTLNISNGSYLFKTFGLLCIQTLV